MYLILQDIYWVGQILHVRKVKFKYLAQSLVSRVLSYTFSVLVCCIRLIWDWWFHLYHHITNIGYFVASYLFLLWFDWPSWHFLCYYLKRFGFAFKVFFLSHVHAFSWANLLIRRLKRPWSCFSSYFCFLFISVLLILLSSVLFLVAVNSIPPGFSM